MNPTRNAVDDAVTAWGLAPLHVKTMAGNYVRPILIALHALNAQQAAQQAEINEIKRGLNGNHP